MSPDADCSRERTVWRLVGYPEWPGKLDVELTVDTAAPEVVEAVERAAAANGLELVRVQQGPVA